VVMTPHFAARELSLGATHAGFGMFNLPVHFKRLLPQTLDYPTPPSEQLAQRIEALLGGPVLRNPNRRGFDHTTWMPLLSLFPAADVPVLELGYPYLPEARGFALGQRLAALRDEGILFLASGGMTHNLGMMSGPTPSFASEFDAWASECIAKKDVDALLSWRAKAPASDLAHPDDGGHFRVLHVALGVALHARSALAGIGFPVTGFEGALSKRCVQLG
jgi:4,5-DOPA dioxygenase extradiol